MENFRIETHKIFRNCIQGFFGQFRVNLPDSCQNPEFLRGNLGDFLNSELKLNSEPKLNSKKYIKIAIKVLFGQCRVNFPDPDLNEISLR